MKNLFALLTLFTLAIITTVVNAQFAQNKSSATTKQAPQTKKDGTVNKPIQKVKAAKPAVLSSKKKGRSDTKNKANKKAVVNPLVGP